MWSGRELNYSLCKKLSVIMNANYIVLSGAVTWN